MEWHRTSGYSFVRQNTIYCCRTKVRVRRNTNGKRNDSWRNNGRERWNRCELGEIYYSVEYYDLWRRMTIPSWGWQQDRRVRTSDNRLSMRMWKYGERRSGTQNTWTHTSVWAPSEVTACEQAFSHERWSVFTSPPDVEVVRYDLPFVRSLILRHVSSLSFCLRSRCFKETGRRAFFGFAYEQKPEQQETRWSWCYIVHLRIFGIERESKKNRVWQHSPEMTLSLRSFIRSFVPISHDDDDDGHGQPPMLHGFVTLIA